MLMYRIISQTVTTSTCPSSTKSALSSASWTSSSSLTRRSSKCVYFAIWRFLSADQLLISLQPQVNSIGAENGEQASGPLWGRFFGGAVGDDDDTESVVSGTAQSESLASAPFTTPSRPGHRTMSSMDTPTSEVFPNDSASAIDDGLSDIGGARRGPGHASSVGASAPPPPVDDGTYLFKFVAPGGTTHRFQARYDSHEFIVDIVAGKLSSDPFFTTPIPVVPATPLAETEEGATPPPPPVATTPSGPDPKDFKMSYLDDDGDMVLMTADRDVQDAVSTARKQGKDRVVIQLTGGAGWDEEISRRGLAAKAKKAPLVAVDEETEEVDDDEQEVKPKKTKKARATSSADDELVFGVVPKEFLLPISIGFLGVVIVAVFAASKAGGPAAGRY